MIANTDPHTLALSEGKDHYLDPLTGYRVFTRKYLAKRGECCGSGCRHCPYSDLLKERAEPRTLDSCAS